MPPSVTCCVSAAQVKPGMDAVMAKYSLSTTELSIRLNTNGITYVSTTERNHFRVRLSEKTFSNRNGAAAATV